MARLTKQADGRYHTTVVVGHDARGKAIRRPIAGRTLKEIDDKREQVLRHYALGGKARAEIMMDQYIVEWYATYKKPNTGEKNAMSARTILNAQILPAFGQRQVRAVTTGDIQTFLQELADKQYSASHVRKCKSLLNQILRQAVAEGIIPYNPATATVMPKIKAASKTKRRPFTAEETSSLLYVGDNHPEGLLILVLYYTGIRLEEALGVQGKSINLRTGDIRIRHAIGYVNGRISIDTRLKNRSSYRTVVAPPPLLTKLREQPCIGDAYLFGAPTDPAKPLPAATFKRRWARLMAAAGTPNITPHWFRHNFISMMVDKGVKPEELMQLTGHTDTRVLLSTYYHVTETGEQNLRQKVLDVWESHA